jgi:hypothetical protein
VLDRRRRAAQQALHRSLVHDAQEFSDLASRCATREQALRDVPSCALRRHTGHAGSDKDAAMPQVLILSLINGTVCTFLPVLMVMMGIARIGAPLASQCGMIGPVSTISLGAIFLGERITPPLLAGTGLVVAGIWLLASAPARARPAATHVNEPREAWTVPRDTPATEAVPPAQDHWLHSTHLAPVDVTVCRRLREAALLTAGWESRGLSRSPFVRGAAQPNRRKGSALGLAVVKLLATTAAWDVGIRSDTGGTTFFVVPR